MIKSIFDEDDNNTETSQPDEKEDRSRANVLGIFGEETEPSEKKTETASGPFDISGLDLPFPVSGRSSEQDKDEPPAQEQPVSALTDAPEPDHSETQRQPPTPLEEYSPPTAAETIRMSGLALSAGVMLFGPIAFLMVIGWFADLLLGSSPWGVVGGIVLGSIIGFVQLFRINAEIIRITNRNKPPKPAGIMSLKAAEDQPPAPKTETEQPVQDSADKPSHSD